MISVRKMCYGVFFSMMYEKNPLKTVDEKQYQQYLNWVDMITVIGGVNEEVIKNLSGVVLVANMSNGSSDYTDNAIKIANNNISRIIGFVSQKRMPLLTMTPAINLQKTIIKDQNYNMPKDIDTDIYIVGRAIYEADDPESVIKKLFQ